MTDPHVFVQHGAGDERARGVVEQHAHGHAQAARAQAALQQRRHVHAAQPAALEALRPRDQLARRDGMMLHGKRECEPCNQNSSSD